MGILTWIFVDGHFQWLNFISPADAPVIRLDRRWSSAYPPTQCCLVSRMVEARERGMSTGGVQVGTAATRRIVPPRR